MNAVAPLLKALSDTQRLTIAALVSGRALPLAHIAATAGLTPAVVAHHLRVLEQAGLVAVTGVRDDATYRFRARPLRDALHDMRPASSERPPLESATDDETDDERKVLSAFFKEGRLTGLPAQSRKRAVVLRFLVWSFEAGRTYREKEVNGILGAYHDDVAMLRRALVDAQLLDRDSHTGIYWRPRRPRG